LAAVEIKAAYAVTPSLWAHHLGKMALMGGLVFALERVDTPVQNGDFSISMMMVRTPYGGKCLGLAEMNNY